MSEKAKCDTSAWDASAKPAATLSKTMCDFKAGAEMPGLAARIARCSPAAGRHSWGWFATGSHKEMRGIVEWTFGSSVAWEGEIPKPANAARSCWNEKPQVRS
jgi:hypothetical protein